MNKRELLTQDLIDTVGYLLAETLQELPARKRRDLAELLEAGALSVAINLTPARGDLFVDLVGHRRKRQRLLSVLPTSLRPKLQS